MLLCYTGINYINVTLIDVQKTPHEMEQKERLLGKYGHVCNVGR